MIAPLTNKQNSKPHCLKIVVEVGASKNDQTIKK